MQGRESHTAPNISTQSKRGWLGVHGVIREGGSIRPFIGGINPITPNVHDVQTNQHLKLRQKLGDQGRESHTTPNIPTQSKRGWLGVHGVIRGGDRLGASPHIHPNVHDVQTNQHLK